MKDKHMNIFSLNPKPTSSKISSHSMVGKALTPLMEGPDEITRFSSESRKERWTHWMRSRLPRANPSASDLRLLLGIMGTPLAPVHVSAGDHLPQLSLKNVPIEIASAKYIVQQYIAATGGLKLLNSIKNMYCMGKMKMIPSEFETTMHSRGGGAQASVAHTGGFVLWQMKPDMWCVELALGGCKISAGSNGQTVWRQTPWLGAHAAKGPVRPLRRVLQGLDPLITASMFTEAQCISEININGEDCFILKLATDQEDLKSRSVGPAELIRHNLLGYFSQRTGLLIQLEDSHLSRVQLNFSDESIYWETNIMSFLEDYRSIDGVMIAHAGKSVMTLFRFGETAMSHTRTRMEETWTIDEVAFNVHGLSVDCFIPPADIKSGIVVEACEELQTTEKGKFTGSLIGRRVKVAAFERSYDQQNLVDRIVWSEISPILILDYITKALVVCIVRMRCYQYNLILSVIG
ncbi:hypothetical protein LUZ60_005922 [Juncus effusus]|nr:hypothetical protein LUZ60_005922 [Juncus effusus]